MRKRKIDPNPPLKGKAALADAKRKRKKMSDDLLRENRRRRTFGATRGPQPRKGMTRTRKGKS